MAIVNYCIMAIIQVRDKRDMNEPLSTNDAISKYDTCAKEAFELMNIDRNKPTTNVSLEEYKKGTKK